MEIEDASLREYRRIEIRRPQYPQVIEWVDTEFKVIFTNGAAAPDAKIICLVTDCDEDENKDNEGDV